MNEIKDDAEVIVGDYMFNYMRVGSYIGKTPDKR